MAIPSEGRFSGRQAGWCDALSRAGAEIPEVIGSGWDIRATYLAGQRLAGDPDVTAVLCGNDDIAQGVRRALYDAGRDVPGDVSIVGFDDIPGSAFWIPALTTVRMDFVGLGRACFLAAVAELTGQPRPETELTPPASSCANRPPRHAARPEDRARVAVCNGASACPPEPGLKSVRNNPAKDPSPPGM